MPEGEEERADGADRALVTREEFHALVRRVHALERALMEERSRARAPPAEPQPRTEPEPTFTPVPRPETRPPPPARPPRPAPKPRASMESLLGERLAPRVGALLVFLAALFFLGVAIQRGWIGPLAQLAIAAAAALALVGGGARLTVQRGYGTYPQVLEGTGACVLYLTAFSSYALPYYQEATGLTEAGGGMLMAMVAATTVGLAIRRDARVIAGLGYTLSFVTAGLGFNVLPGLTLSYVAVLGASLAGLVSWKRWTLEALAGTVTTGLFLAGFALRAVDAGDPSPWAVIAAAVLPFAGFVWLTLGAGAARDAKGETPRDPFTGAPLMGIVAFATLAWAVPVSLAAAGAPEAYRARGVLLLLWCAAALALSVVAARRRIPALVPRAYATGALGLYLLWPVAFWDEGAGASFGITLTYLAGALVLALVPRALSATGAGRGAWIAALVLVGAGALRSVRFELQFDVGDTGLALGPPEAWITFLLLAPTLLLLVTGREAPSDARRLALAVAVGILAVWAFALFPSALLSTLYLTAAGAAFALLGIGSRSDDRFSALGGTFPRDAFLAGVALLALGALKAATFDAHALGARLPVAHAVVEALSVAGALLAFHHLGASTRPARTSEPAFLCGGSALVLASFVFAYGEGAWVSILLGLLGTLYLATGFALREHAVYRQTGFAVLGFVLLRVFAVDLQQTDLAVRAVVFAVLGGILLGVGYAYARLGRPAKLETREESPPPEGPR